MRAALLLAPCLIALALAPTADAGIVLYRFDAVATAIDGPAPAALAIGDPFTFTLSYDTDTPLDILFGVRAEAFAGLIHPIGFVLEHPNGGPWITSRLAQSPPSAVTLSDGDEGTDSFHVSLPGIDLVLIDDRRTAFDFLSKDPDDPYAGYYIPTLFAGQFTRGGVFVTEGPWSIRGEVDVDSIEAVAEPSTLAGGVLGLGLAGIAWLRRR